MCYKLLFIFCIEIVHASIAVYPRNQAIVAGQRMEMECKLFSEEKVEKWILQRPGDKDEKTIVSNCNGTMRINPSFARIKLEANANGPFRIYSDETRLDDGGLYTCAVQNGTMPQPLTYSAHLVVIEKEPHCKIELSSQQSSSTVRRVVVLQCTFTFSGYLSPAVEWKRHCHKGKTLEHREEILTEGVELKKEGNSSVTSSVQLPFDSQNKACYVSFKMLFELQNSSTNGTIADNTPPYNYTWKSTDIFDHRHDHRHGKRRNVYIVTVIIVCILVIVFIVCCIACIWFRDKILGLLMCVVNCLQRETTTSNASQRTNAENELNESANNSTENAIYKKNEPQDDQTYEQIDDCYDLEKYSSCQTTESGTIYNNSIYDLKRQSSTESGNCAVARSTSCPQKQSTSESKTPMQKEESTAESTTGQPMPTSTLTRTSKRDFN